MRNVSFAMIAVVSLTAGAMAQRAGGDDSIEDIYVALSVLLSRVTGPSSAQRGGSVSGATARSVHLSRSNDAEFGWQDYQRKRSGDSPFARMLWTDIAFTRPNFYGEGSLGRTSFTGRGECALPRGFPRIRNYSKQVFSRTDESSAMYFGGLLTTNTIVSRQVFGETSDPQG